MKGLDDFRAFVRGLGPDQLALLIGLRELLHRADERGTAERGIWIASLRDRLEAWRHAMEGAGLLSWRATPKSGGRSWSAAFAPPGRGRTRGPPPIR